MVFHALNRGVGRGGIFEKKEDFAALEQVMAHALNEVPVHSLAYCVMPNHWRRQNEGNASFYVLSLRANQGWPTTARVTFGSSVTFSSSRRVKTTPWFPATFGR